MFNQNPHGRSNQQNKFMDKVQQAAFWIAVLATFLMWPQIWSASLWLTDTVFRGQIDYAYLHLMSYLLFGVIFMVLLSLAQAGLGSSAAVLVIWLISKSPMF